MTVGPVRMPGNRMRILAGPRREPTASRHVQPPVTGVFFGVEIIPARLPAHAPFTMVLSAMIAASTAEPSPGSQ